RPRHGHAPSARTTISRRSATRRRSEPCSPPTIRRLLEAVALDDPLPRLTLGATNMTESSEYVPPKVWVWNKPSGGHFANINRPIAGPTQEKELPVGRHPLQ